MKSCLQGTRAQIGHETPIIVNRSWLTELGSAGQKSSVRYEVTLPWPIDSCSVNFFCNSCELQNQAVLPNDVLPENGSFASVLAAVIQLLRYLHHLSRIWPGLAAEWVTELCYVPSNDLEQLKVDLLSIEVLTVP